MYEAGEYVIHGYNGLCKIEEITSLNMRGVDKEAVYYILQPVHSQDSKIYLPIEKDELINRKIMSKEDANQLLDEIPEVEELWNANHKIREEAYKNAMKTCDYREWIRIIKTLHGQREEKEDIGKHLSTSDERYLKHAEEYLYGELALALGMDEESVKGIVTERIAGE